MGNETHKCNTQLEVTNSPEVIAALELIARYYHQKNGIFANEAFDHINYVFFGGNLPRPLIQIAPTQWGRCLGLTFTPFKGDNILPPVITLHPSTFMASGIGRHRMRWDEEKEAWKDKGPWGVAPALLGMSFAYEVLLHECMHIQVNYVLALGEEGESSHNNPAWVGEVKRIGPMLGLSDNVSMNKPRRVPIPGEKTKTGKTKTRVVRGVEDGCLPFLAVFTFPYGMRKVLGKTDFYKDKSPPWQISQYPVTDYYVLQINSLAETTQ